MIALAMLLPVLKMATVFVAARMAWWLLSDLILDTVDLSFLGRARG